MPSTELINFANHLADVCEKIAQKYYRANNGEIAKDDDSPVTKADREIEAIIREEIGKKFPDHGIIGEEYGNHNIDAEFVWILDPIDGTSSFIIGRPLFGTLIALTQNGKSILGIMNQPILAERWVGIAGKGSYFNGQKIHTRNCQNISDAVMCASSSFHFKEEEETLRKKISSMTKYQRLGGIIYGGDCYSYASLASGFVDIVIDPGLQVYDYAALLPIIEEAGGIVTDWEGNDLKLQSDVRLIACANKSLHEQALKILN